MKKLSANVCAVTHAGRVRKENEDNYSLNGRHTYDGGLKKGSAYVQKMTEPFHLAVCDGMGGESYGDVASGIAVEAIAGGAAAVYESGEDFSFAISSCLDSANTKICREITERGARMGTTLASIYTVKGKVYCASIGDTRIYHFSNGILEQASFDHTHAQGIVDAGAVPMSDIGTIPDAKRLTKHLGVFPEEATLQPSISVIDDVENGDVILLCSDGLTDMLSDAEISDIISSGETPQDVSGKLIRKALEKGGKDNVTVVTAFMTAENTAVFVPVAEAMVGDKDPSYEEEYRNSYGGAAIGDEENVSPYANADARAYEQPVDKKKIFTIVGIVAAVILVLALAVVIVMASVKDKDKNKESTTSLEEYYATYTTQTTSQVYTWTEPSTESTTEESTEESTEEETTTTTTRRYTSTTRRYTTTTKRYTTTTKSTTTTTKASTTGTTASSTSATETGTSSADTTSSTSADTTSSTQASTESTSAPSTTESTTESTTSNGGVGPIGN